MTQPTDTTNLDIYGSAPLAWERVLAQLAVPPGPERPFFLGTVRPDGRPHSAGIGATWHDGTLYIVSGPATRKSRNLAANPACTISVRLTDLDVVLEGEAHRVVDPDTLEQVAAVYRSGGWPARVEGDAFTAPYSAPSAGRPPWYLYRFTFHTAFAVASGEPYGATRWRFS
jgi:hypothetical protein